MFEWISNEKQSICIFLWWLFSSQQSSCPALPGSWASRGGWGLPGAPGSGVPPDLTLSGHGWWWRQRLQGSNGRMCLSGLCETSSILFCFWFSRCLILRDSTLSVVGICRSPFMWTGSSEFQEVHRDFGRMIVRNPVKLWFRIFSLQVVPNPHCCCLP